MATSEWEIPPELQPDPAELGFDLDGALRSVVAVKAMVPADAFTAAQMVSTPAPVIKPPITVKTRRSQLSSPVTAD